MTPGSPSDPGISPDPGISLTPGPSLTPGSPGGGFRHGRHVAFDAQNNTPLANLFVTMLQRLGIETDRFASSSGGASQL